jgi:hypothetical protein
MVVYFHRRWFSWWTFWLSLAICLVVHSILIFGFFQYILHNVQRLSPLLWASIAGLDFFALLLTIAKMENKLSGDRYRKGEPIQLG